MLAKYKTLFHDYAQHSTIHGVSYITEQGRSWVEKLWWITVLCLSVVFCGKLIFDATNISPIIISFTAKPTPVWQIPFPTVTICPSSVTNWSLTEVFKHGDENFHSLSEEKKKMTLAVNALCDIEWKDVLRNYTNCNGCLETIRNLKVPPAEFFIECKFRNKIFNCTEALEEIVLYKQFCYTFNGLKVYRATEADDVTSKEEEWSLDDGYKPQAPASAYPRRVFSAGPKYGLSLLLRSDQKYYDRECRESESFYIEYRMPYEAPQIRNNYVMLLMQRSLTLILTPKMIVTSDEVRDYSLAERKCYFSNERPLKYIRQYTQVNCEIECEADEILKNCGCLPMFLENQNGIDVCGPYHSACTDKTLKHIFDQNHRLCNCSPLCSSITFESEIFVSNLNTSVAAKDGQVRYSRLNIYFKENQFMTLQRTERYGKTDLLANCGGILGLCLGVSVISLVEIFHYCTIRLWTTTRSTENRAHSSTAWVEPGQRQLSVKSLITEYLSKTTLQGVKYMGEPGVSKAERIWWVVILGISVFFCGTMVFNVVTRYETTPVIISYADEETPISQIPFPAVTICPQIFTRYVDQIYDDLKVKNVSLYTMFKYQYDSVTALAQVCDPSVFSDVDPQNMTNCENCLETLKTLVGDIKTYFYVCQHISQEGSCPDMFQTVATQDGICFAYNVQQVFRNLQNTTNNDITDNWTLEGGYRYRTDKADIHPRAGSKFPFMLFAGVEKALQDNICRGVIPGFNVYLHLPIESPQSAKHVYLMPYQHHTQMKLQPRVTVTAPELRDFSVSKRQCYFSDERYLRFFRHYTQNNCELECLANLTMRRCGCLMFYMPKIAGVNYCGISEVVCQQETHKLSAEQNIIPADADTGCHCLSTCTSIVYDIEVNHVSYTDEENADRFSESFVAHFRFLMITIGFQKNDFVALKRSLLFGKTEILANCGGLLGLFLGFSFISILELFYFCTIRLCVSVKMHFFE